MPPVLWIAAALAGAVGFQLYLEGRARSAVDSWALEHRYRVRRCSRRWFAAAPRASPSERGLAPNWRQGPVVFRVELDDLQLGGSGVANVRCWVGWLTGGLDEVEVDWVRMPEAPDATGRPPSGKLPERWDDAQLALLHRIAAGEASFEPADRYDQAAGRAFDELVEHLLAMRQRGLVRFPEPLANGRPAIGRYAAVGDVTLTDEGARIATRAR